MSDNPRQVINFNADWRFSKSDPDAAETIAFDDSGWEQLDVPHDWAIKGPFSEDDDMQYIQIMQDGEKKASSHSGRTGGLPHVGVGWYRKAFTLPAQSEGKRVFIEFDGAMSYAKIYLNGQYIDSWPFGYASFCLELTDHIKFDSENTLAVRLDVKDTASRWYPGAGIYRNVRLVVVDPIHVVHWGTYVTTPEVDTTKALVRIETRIQNHRDGSQAVTLGTTILDPAGKQVGECTTDAVIAGIAAQEQEIAVANPRLWNTTTPQLYTAISSITIEGKLVDKYETTFGIRTISFDANKGFLLNGERIQLNGVCMHHDMGPLGSAVNKRALERQYEILAEMGCNALRTSHNPPAPEVLDICDRMGFLVLDEAFDEWQIQKVDNGYHLLFDEWAEKDLRAMIRRDRNHPCVIMWSIGNEICEQRSEDGANVAKFLCDICHDEDPTRPTTAGFNDSDNAIKNGLAEAVDVPGWNYKPQDYERYHREHPDWPHYGSETESCISSRGEYYFPAREENQITRDSLHVPSYDLAHPSWGYSPDVEFAAQDACPHIMGEFVWTGFDYLGEPTPYNHEWPSRSSYFGIIDLVGIPKDRYYLYQSKWTDKQVLHLLPHWNWEGREGEITPVHCYTSFDSAELFLNGKSQGVQTKNSGVMEEMKDKDFSAVKGRYRLVWDDVKYEPGVLKVVGLDDNGEPVAEAEMKTAGPATRVELLPDRTAISADGLDLSYVTVKVVDENGTVCPLADNMINFSVEGTGRIVAVGSGDQSSVEPFVADHRKVFHGLCMLIVASKKGESGEMKITALAEGLASAASMVTSR